MPYGLYDGSLESIPGLGGYVQQQKLNDTRALQGVQQASGIMGLLKAQKEQQDDQAIRAVLAQGGEPGQMVQGLVKLGSPQAMTMANHVMTVNQGTQRLAALKGLDMKSPDAPRILREVALTDPTQSHAYIALADHLEKQAADVAENKAQVSQDTPLTDAPMPGLRNGVMADRSIIPPGNATVPVGTRIGNQQTTEAIPPEVAAAMASGRPFSIGEGQSTNPAENTQRTGGLFSQFFNSPISAIRSAAISDQTALDASNPASIPPKSWNDKASQLGTNQGMQMMFGQRDATANRAIDVSAAKGGLNPDATPMEGSTLSPDAIEAAAAKYRIDRTLPPNMGRGGQGALDMRRIVNRAAEMAQQDGQTAEAQALGQIANKASAQGLAQISRQEATLGAFEKNALKNADLALAASEKVDRTGVPVFNRWLQAGRTAITGDVDARVFNASNSTFVSEYAKVMSGGTGAAATTEGATHRAQDLLNTADTKEAYRAVINQLKLEMHNRMVGFAEQKKELLQGMGSSPDQPADSNTPLSDLQVKLPDGTIATFKSGAQVQAFKAAHGLK